MDLIKSAVYLSVSLLFLLHIPSCSRSLHTSLQKNEKTCERSANDYDIIKCYTEKIKQAPDNIELYLRRAKHFVTFMKYNDALYDYVTAYDLSEKEPFIAQKVACMYIQLGNYSRAKQWYVSSLVSTEKSGISRDELIELCHRDSPQSEPLISTKND